MKHSLACPKCQSRKLWRIDHVKHETEFLGGRALPVAIWTVPGQGWRGGTEAVVGAFSAYVCAKCGYSELWARDFEALEHDAERGVHLVDATAKPGRDR